MPAPFSTLVLDLHNTLYDEALEYGLSLDEAVTAWREIAKAHGHAVEAEVLYGELSAAHRKLGSDWDTDAWRMLPSLAKLNLPEDEFDNALRKGEALRKRKSRELVESNGYEGMRETLAALKAQGVPVYVVTEAAADAGMEILSWLKLGGIVDGFYSWPSRVPPQVIEGTYHKPFPAKTSGGHLKKPHPLVLAAVVLDEAVRRKLISPEIQIKDVFEIAYEKGLSLAELPADAPAQQDIGTQLIIQPTPYATALKQIMDGMLYVGDSKFKDGLLARNAGVAFGWAAYGKKIKPGNEDLHRKSIAIMYAVTGWEPEELKLTQEAGKSATVAALQPHHVFAHTLAEALNLF